MENEKLNNTITETGGSGLSNILTPSSVSPEKIKQITEDIISQQEGALEAVKSKLGGVE